jgi:hypothetical protein
MDDQKEEKTKRYLSFIRNVISYFFRSEKTRIKSEPDPNITNYADPKHRLRILVDEIG